ncbi:MAG: hypothetical protein Q4E62_09615 [Sutterellaceae bacterium]|nr:hypothetical protein [Sutterellaceae bacterium]
MTFNTPVLTDRVPYSWDELKAHAIDSNPATPHHVQAANDAAHSFAQTQTVAQGVELKPLEEVNVRRIEPHPQPEAPVAKPTVADAQAFAQAFAQPMPKPVTEPVAQPKVSVVAPQPQAPVVDDKLVGEIVNAVVPLIMERLHAQVSILVDMTMKQAASKIRNDFDNALKGTVQSAVQKVVEEKLKA